MSTEAINRNRQQASLDDRGERAREAVKQFRKMQMGLTSYARAITGNRLVRVQMDSGVPRTDGKTIYYRPPIALGDKTEHQRRVCDERDPDTLLLLCPACKVREEVLVNIYHEIAHIAFGTFAPTTERAKVAATEHAVKEYPSRFADRVRAMIENAPARNKESYLGLAGLISPFLPHLVNCIEDARVDAAMFRARKGTKKMVTADTFSLFRDGIPQPDGTMKHWSEAPLNNQAAIACYLVGAGYEGWREYLHPKIGADFSDKLLVAQISKISKTRSAAETYELSFPILARLRELGYFRMPEDEDADEQPEEPETDQPEEEEKDDEAETEKDEESGDSEEGDADDDGESDDSSDDDAESEGDAEGSDSDDSEGDGGEGADEASDESGEPDSSGEGGDSEADAEGQGGDGDGPDVGDEADAEGPEDDSTGADPDGGEGDSDSSDSGDGEGPEDDAAGEGGSPGDSPSDESGPEGEGSAPDGAGDTETVADGGTSEGEEGEETTPADREAEASDDDKASDGAGDPPDSAEADPSDGSGDAESSDEGAQEGGSPSENSGEPGDHQGGASVGPQEGSPDRDDLQDGDVREGEDVDGHEDGRDGGEDADDAGRDSDQLGDVQSDTAEGGTPDGTESDDDESGEVLESGADEGQGGIKVEETLNYGTIEEYTAAQEGATLHDHIGEEKDEEKDGLTLANQQVTEAEDQKAIKVAIVQGLYFETPSTNVSGVQEFDDGVTGDSWTRGLDMNTHEKTYYGVTCDMDIPESVMGPALLKLRRVFSDNKIATHEHNRKSGRVDKGVLGRRAWNGDERLFTKKRIPGKKNYAVLIGVDLSSSTLGDNLSLAKRAAFAQADLCQRLGVDFAVYGHNATWANGGLSMDIYIIKSWDQPWNDAAKERISTVCGAGGNLDGHSMEYYRKALDRIEATDKVLMYYTDGKMPAANFEEELEVLQREIKTCKKRNYTLMAVGIRTDSPIQHGLDTVQVNDDTDLQRVVDHLGKRLTAPAR